jgi:hypothetical protein
MTGRERSDLQSLAKMNARVSKADVDAVVADRVADFERGLQREWSAQELQVQDLMTEVNERVQAINDEITRRCDDLDIRPELRPQMLAGLMTRRHLSKDRETELRRLARAELEAAGKRAKVEIDRQTASICGEIVASGLSSSEAHAMLGRVETPQQLVPEVSMRELESRFGGGR